MILIWSLGTAPRNWWIMDAVVGGICKFMDVKILLGKGGYEEREGRG